MYKSDSNSAQNFELSGSDLSARTIVRSIMVALPTSTPILREAERFKAAALDTDYQDRLS